MRLSCGVCILLSSLFLWSGEKAERIWVTLDAKLAPVLQDELNTLGMTLELVGEGKDKLVVAAHVTRKHLDEITRIMHQHMNRCGGFRVHENRAEALKVDGLVKTLNRRAMMRKAGGYVIDNGQAVNQMLDLVRENAVADVIINLSNFENRFYNTQSGIDSAHWLRDYWDSITEGRDDASTELYPHNGFPQPSVILTLRGWEFPDEVVVLGAHLDSTVFAGTNAPGADDDASGIACISEAARVVAESGFRPRRTVKFMGYAGEEHGLLGSEDIADDFRSKGVDVVGVLQLDMTNFHGSVEDMWLMTDYTDNPLTQFTAQLIDTYLEGVTRSTSSCGYPCSDHASWFFASYPVAMPAESRFGEHNPNLHTPNDTIAVSGGRAVHAEKFARLATAFVGEVAKGDFQGGPGLMENTVTVRTLLDLMSAYGPCSGLCPRDIDNNGQVNSTDLRQLWPDWSGRQCLGFGQGAACQ